MIIPVNKPAGMTSHDVVAKIKRAMKNAEKIGHTGTLDPMCTGVLPVLTGKYTKLSDLLPSDKAYRCGILLGKTTDTQDVTGNILTESDEVVSEDEFKAVLPHFIGEQRQVPPMYSAIKKDGVPRYKLARKGIEIEREARIITIYDIVYESSPAENEFVFTVKCSSGTYIRTLCEDIGRKLGCGACMESLERILSNGFSLEQAHSLEEVIEAAGEGTLEKLSCDCESAFSQLKSVTIPENGLKYYLNGGVIAFDRVGFSASEGTLCRAYSENSRFLGLAAAQKDGIKNIWSEL